jgi:hypothetical protein
LVGGPRFHFDERDDAAAAGNDIHFPPGHARSPRKDAPAAEAKPPAGESLGSTTALFRLLPVHLDRSSARA